MAALEAGVTLFLAFWSVPVLLTLATALHDWIARRTK
jgi:hypothetical protein